MTNKFPIEKFNKDGTFTQIYRYQLLFEALIEQEKIYKENNIEAFKREYECTWVGGEKE